MTCAHNVASLTVGDEVNVIRGDLSLYGTLRYKSPESLSAFRSGSPWPFPDVAVIQLREPIDVEPLRFTLMRTKTGDELEAYGFPAEGFEGGESVRYTSSGYAYAFGFPRPEYLIHLTDGTVRIGMSGAPVVYRGTQHVVGMIVDSIDPLFQFGGHAMPTQYLLEGASILDSLAVLDPPERRHTEAPADFTAQPLAAQIETETFIPNASALEAGEGDSSSPPSMILVEQSRSLRRLGRPRDAHQIAQSARDDAEFTRLNQGEQAAVIRELAITYMETGNLEKAQRLCAEASALDPTAARQVGLEAELRGLIDGPDAALEVLDGNHDPEVEVFRAGFLIQARRFDDALEILERIPEPLQSDARTHRLAVLVHMGRRDRSRMLVHADAAFHAFRVDSQVAYLTGCAYVLATLSPGLWPSFPWTWPQPISVDSRLEARERREYLDRARLIFETLVSRTEPEAEQIQWLQAWSFVALAVNEHRRVEATEEAARLLEGDNPNYRVIPWIWSLRIDVPVTRAVELLRARIDSGMATPEETSVVVCDALERHQAPEAERILRQTEQNFAEASASSNWRYLLFLTLHEQGHASQARAELDFMQPDHRRAAELILAEAPPEANQKRSYI